MKTQIIYEDKDILVIYKPEGLASQSAKVTQTDVVSEMCTYLKSSYVGLVHRLDQPVEGLMVLGKNKTVTANLSGQLAKGELKKTYLAVVGKEDGDASDISAQWTKLTDFLEKDGKAGKAQVVKNGGQEAILFYRKLQQKDNRTALVEIDLVTGRFHQIRAQMSHAGMALLGDVKYGTGNSIEITQELSKDVEIKNVALCAYKIKFQHPKTKKAMEFEIKPKKPVFNSYEI